jgi:hypothetical protein
MKKETLEEAADNWVGKPIIGTKRDSFIAGAKWQSERMFSEIEKKWLEYRSNTNNEDAWCFKEWLVEQFKSE